MKYDDFTILIAFLKNENSDYAKSACLNTMDFAMKALKLNKQGLSQFNRSRTAEEISEEELNKIQEKEI